MLCIAAGLQDRQEHGQSMDSKCMDMHTDSQHARIHLILITVSTTQAERERARGIVPQQGQQQQQSPPMQQEYGWVPVYIPVIMVTLC